MIGVAIIGLGRIASGYDEISNAADVARSHIGAIRQTRGIRLVGAVEPDKTRRVTARAHWNGEAAPFCATIGELTVDNIDVVVICTPTAIREQVVAAALSLHPRVIIVEKPLADSLDSARRIAIAAERAGVALYVNFHRRFDPRHRTLHQQVLTDPVTRVLATYNNGLHNYASHAVDLLLDWFGPVDEVRALAASSATGDPNLSFSCCMHAGFDAAIIGVDGLDYDLFDITFFTERARYELQAGGAHMEAQVAVDSRYYAGYRHLGEAELLLPDGPVGGLADMYAALRDSLAQNMPFPACTAADALEGMTVLHAALASASNDQLPIVPRDLIGAPLA